MAYRVSNGTGTAFNTAANWDEGINTPSIHASTNITITSGGVNSATFTAPNTTNACTGVVVPVVVVGTAGNIIATLQENTGSWADVAGATATVAITSLVPNARVFFKFTTPYVFTATTAGRYRIKLNTSGASGTTSIAADSGGGNFAYLAFMNNKVVPTTGDDVFCISPNQGSALTMSLDASPSFGSGTNTTVPVYRSWGNGLVVANNGGLSWPAATSRTVTLKGNVVVERNGDFQMGTTSAQIQAGVTARLAFDQNGTTVNYGFQHLTGGRTLIQGAPKTYKKTTLSSGVGTAASPAVFADSVDWSVGDEVVFVPATDSATNYNETEVRFIITKNSATSYVLSSTSGGAETALTYTHTGGYAFNVTRQCIIDTTNTSHAWYADFAETLSAANVNIDGARLETFGSTTTGKTTILFSNLASELCELDDIVFYRNSSTTGVTLGNNNDTRTYTWLIFYSGSTLFSPGSLRNKRFENTWLINSTGTGLNLSANAADVFDTGGAFACGTAGQGQGILMTNVTKCTFKDFEAHANRQYGARFSNAVDIDFLDCLIGTLAINGSGSADVIADTYNKGLFSNCLFGDSTVFASYTGMADGSEVAFDTFNQTTNDHRWYTPYGIARSTGSGLADTNVRTSGTLNVRIAPENSSTGFTWDFKILAKANSAVYINGFIQKNAAFGTDDATAELYLPGLVPGTDTPTDTYSMPDNTSYNVFSLAGNYTGSVPRYAIVRIKGQTTTASAYLYVADLYNGTNDITNLTTWDRGKPSEIMFEQLGDAAAVWAVDTSGLTTAGTTGKKLVDDLTTVKFLATK